MPRALIVTGLLYGDEGKGTIVDYLARKHKATLVVRHNGGAQAAHNVVTPDGRHHTFAQWGSGTFAGARTFLSRYMIVDPLAMDPEAYHLRSVGIEDPWSMLSVDERALVITPYHRAANRIREMSRGEGRHGSCGVGVGEAYDDRDKPHAIRWGDLGRSAVYLRERLHEVRDEKRMLVRDISGPRGEIWRKADGSVDELAEWMQDVYKRVIRIPWYDQQDTMEAHENIIFEGAQGVLLDQFRGDQPYTTWSNTTSEQARAMLYGTKFDVTKIGVMRAYATRHGAGPLLTEHAGLTASLAPKDHNGTNQWQGSFRCGWFDAREINRAIRIEDGVDEIALTCVDQIESVPEAAFVDQQGRASFLSGSDPGLSERHIRSFVDGKITIVSHGPTANEKRETR